MKVMDVPLLRQWQGHSISYLSEITNGSSDGNEGARSKQTKAVRQHVITPKAKARNEGGQKGRMQTISL